MSKMVRPVPFSSRPGARIYFCKAWLDPETSSVGGNRKLYLVLDPEELRGLVILDWCAAQSSFFFVDRPFYRAKAKGLGKGASTTWYRSAQAVNNAMVEFCKAAHGGHTTPPAEPLIPLTPDLLDRFMRGINSDGVYTGPSLAKLQAALLRERLQATIASPVAASQASSSQHRVSSVSHQSASSSSHHHQASSSQYAPEATPRASAPLPCTSAHQTADSMSSHRRETASTAPPQVLSSRSAPRATPPPASRIVVPLSSEGSPRSADARTQRRSEDVPRSADSQRRRRVEAIARALALMESVGRWSQEAADAMQFDAASEAGTIGNIDEDGPAFIVTSKDLPAAVIFARWGEAQQFRAQLLVAGNEDARVHAPLNAAQRRDVLRLFAPQASP
ncbi:hypothetical protein GGF50DRAFT_121082 [Schizophyllum commune]